MTEPSLLDRMTAAFLAGWRWNDDEVALRRADQEQRARQAQATPLALRQSWPAPLALPEAGVRSRVIDGLPYSTQRTATLSTSDPLPLSQSSFTAEIVEVPAPTEIVVRRDDDGTIQPVRLAYVDFDDSQFDAAADDMQRWCASGTPAVVHVMGTDRDGLPLVRLQVMNFDVTLWGCYNGWLRPQWQAPRVYALNNAMHMADIDGRRCRPEIP